ncbi:hypothetical protein E1J03_21705 [Phocaeicola dorei]|nr:hypothetical protein E1J03_24390 [Phocaeicola dorei]TDB22154.1 hypothetical protein E1J03_21705 [Phocaeicola dorei]
MVKQTWEISLIVICTWYLTLAGLRERERIRPREDGWFAFYGSFEKKLFQKNFRKHLVVTIKSLTFASAFGNDGKQE